MIKNLTKDVILLNNFEKADSSGKRMKGLMFRDSLSKDSGLLMVFPSKRKHEIWMFGMRFAIDIIFISKGKKIVDIRHSAKPIGKNPLTWKIYRPKKQCRYVLEINAGLAKKTRTEIGDVLDF